MTANQFDRWMAEVDDAVISVCGMSVHDLADADFAVWYDDDITPKAAAAQVLRAEGWTLVSGVDWTWLP